MNRTPFKIWLWREFKKTASEASLKTKLAFALPLLLMILFVIVNATNNDDTKAFVDGKSTPTKEKEKYQESDIYEISDAIDGEISEDYVDILGDMRRVEILEGKESAYANLLNQKAVLVSLVNSENGIVIDTDPLGLKQKGGVIIEVVDSIFKGSKPGRLLILEIEENNAYLHKLPNEPFLNKLQEISYELHGP